MHSRVFSAVRVRGGALDDDGEPDRGTVGFIGLGIMGDGMARQLLKSGRSLVVWNRNIAKSEALLNDWKVGGALDRITIAASAADVIEQCELTYTMLSDHEASTAVYHDSDGILAGLDRAASPRSIVDAATLSVEHMQGLEKEVASRKGLFLEAPVSGSKAPAANGQLIFLCGGDPALYEASEVQADLGAMGKASYLIGNTVGSGTKMKLVANMIMGTMLTSLGEGLCLCDNAGIDQDTLIEVLGLGAMANPMFHMKGPSIMTKSHHPPNFPLKHATKDMRLAIALAENIGLDVEASLPVSSAATREFDRALELGWGDDDFSAVCEQRPK